MANLAFTAFIKSKGYNKKRLSEECHIPPAVISQRINGRSPWEWREVGRVCQALDITYMKKGRNFSSDKKQFAEYRKVLGDKVPDSVYKFQDLKYNDIEIWHALKTLKRQTMFVEKAQCETTERKFKEYLLKPGAKHAKEFFDVGYAKENPIQLRYDIAKQYDESKVQNVIELEDGSKKYSIPMKLGITEKKQFLTCWIKEPGNGKPRITTAYRKDADE